MNLLGIVQALHNEAKLTGSAPTGVAGQAGRAADLVRWAIEAWNDIQRDRDGKWNWLRGDFYVDTIAGTASYASTDCKDKVTSAAITRFRAWDLDSREPPLIFLSSDGKGTEREMFIDDWAHFRYLYLRGTHTASYPGSVVTDVLNNLHIGPKPDAVYRITGNYWKSNQTLVDDDDIPEMPADYHFMIVYRAIVKYAYNTVSHEILARAQADGAPMYDALALNQAYSRFSFSVADALA
ncbi:MAG: hypothetical protein IIB77_00550 [Proteobacteria bacterium]|nr:hypothetical protein [Pseudomonadota bacterium]